MTCSATRQQSAFERYFHGGGGFFGIGAAIEAEPGWEFLSDLLGTRASGMTDAQQATVKVADRGHAAGGKALPEHWQHTDRWYNFTSSVRGVSHVIATVDETTYTGGTMEANPANGVRQPPAEHPIIWCKDYQGGRSFYTGIGNTAASFDGAEVRAHLAGAVTWAAGMASPIYSDCGATVLANYQQVKISAPPNLNEPIGFDQFPDGRIIQTARGGQLRLHDPAAGTTKVIADFSSASLPTTLQVYTNSEDGLYGPAVDADFATNHWVYLYYAPQTVRIRKCDGTMADVTTPNGSAPTVAADPCVWTDTWTGYFQLSRFKFVDGENPSLDFDSEQKILQVSNNRGACCHVAGDIDFDKHGNLWLVTGDDTPAGGGNSGGFSPHNDMKTNESQVLRVNGATGGTFTLSFNGQTTAPIAYDATSAVTQAALEALSNIAPGDVVVSGNAINAGNQTVSFRGAYSETNVAQITGGAAGLTGSSPSVAATTAANSEGGLYNAPFVDARRSAQNTNDLRGKVLRIKVGADGTYTIPDGNLFAPGTAKTRPEIYAMGFRNPFRIQVDENDVAYVTDYSPDSNVPENFRGPAGTGRVEIVRKPSNYGWPLCYSPDLPYYRWDFNTSSPLDNPPMHYECDNPTRGPQNSSRWVRDGGPSVEPGLEYAPPITQPDIWYAYRDNANPPLGTPCLASYDGSGGTCPQLFPELFTGGVAPHGAAKYHYDPSNPNPAKFPPYYDNSVFFGEFGQDTLREIRLDSQNKVFKINPLLDCGAVSANSPFTFECDNPMDMQFGADGAFYLLTYGDGFFSANADAGMYKWEYVKGQRAPRGVLTTDRTNGGLPLTVQFSSAGTSDPDPGDAIMIEWDFGDGSPISTEADPSHTYTQPGVYTAKLTVKDSSGKQDIKSTVITAGNTAPAITIQTPLDGDFFEWGQNIPFRVTGTDAEDGTIDCSKVRVTFVLVHDQHGHAEDEKIGCTGYLTTVADDASHGGYIAGGISVSYTDKPVGSVPALSTTEQVIIQTKRQQVEYAQEQSGTTTTASSEDDPGGGQVRNSLDPGDWIAINNKVNLTNSEKRITLRFAGPGAFPPFIPVTPAGTDLIDVEVRDGSPTGPVLTTVRIKSTGDASTWESFSAPLNFEGSKRLYLVFSQVSGGPVIPFLGWGNLNWVEFGGQGVGIPPDFFPQPTAPVGGTVPATLSLALGAPLSFGAFTPGVARDYLASTTANVISTAGDATLSVADPSSTSTGHLVNGSNALPQALQANATSAGGSGGSFAPVGGSSNPTSLLTYGSPVANDTVTIAFKQSIGANDPLRTGSYTKTLTFTLSTTTP